MKSVISIALAALFSLSVATSAYAHCGACGTGDKEHKSCHAKCADAKDKDACKAKCDKKDDKKAEKK